MSWTVLKMISKKTSVFLAATSIVLLGFASPASALDPAPDRDGGLSRTNHNDSAYINFDIPSDTNLIELKISDVDIAAQASQICPDATTCTSSGGGFQITINGGARNFAKRVNGVTPRIADTLEVTRDSGTGVVTITLSETSLTFNAGDHLELVIDGTYFGADTSWEDAQVYTPSSAHTWLIAREVHFLPNGASSNNITNNPSQPYVKQVSWQKVSQVRSLDPMGEATDFIYTDHTFVGWNTASDGTGTQYDDGADYSTNSLLTDLYAMWNSTVTFDANDGSGTPATATQAYYKQKALDANTFTRIGYTFAGWAETPTGDVAYADHANFSFTENKTLYAKWTVPTVNPDPSSSSNPDPNSSSSPTTSKHKLGTVSFASGSSVLTGAAKKSLKKWVKANKTHSSSTYSIVGYLQKGEGGKKAKTLALARAKAVQKYLKTLGVKVKISTSKATAPKKILKTAKARKAELIAIY